MDAASTSGVKRPRTSRTSRLLRPHISRGTGTTFACGQRRSAWAVGMADRQPNRLVSYDADVTTPRPSGDPPTSSSGSRPAPSGSASRAHWTKNWSQSRRSRRRMREV
jgi:hypothetical protein